MSTISIEDFLEKYGNEKVALKECYKVITLGGSTSNGETISIFMYIPDVENQYPLSVDHYIEVSEYTKIIFGGFVKTANGEIIEVG